MIVERQSPTQTFLCVIALHTPPPQGKGKVGEQWNKIFMEIFRLMSHGFLLLSPVSLAELCSFWYGFKDLFTLHKLNGQSCP